MPTAAGNALNFSTLNVNRGTAITHIPGTGQFNILESGPYEISYASTAAKACPSQNATALLSLKINGTTVPGSTASSSISGDIPAISLSNTSIMEITAPATLTLNAGNTGAEFSASSITIKKLANL